MYYIADKNKAEALSGFAGELLKNPAMPGSGDPKLNNDLRHRSYIMLVEVIESIGAAAWDYAAGQTGRWIAGKGKVRIYRKLVDNDQSNITALDREIDKWRYCTETNPKTTIQYQEVERYCYNHTCYSYPSTEGQEPVLYLAWEDSHGTLWIEPLDSDTTNKPFPVEATECIYPGQGSTTVKKYTYDGTEWVPTTDTCTIHDPTCMLMALPGDIFWVTPVGTSSDGLCSGDTDICNANVMAPYGTHRRVRVESEIPCNKLGTAKILTPDPENSTGDCKEVLTESPDPDPCAIQVCNKSGRSVMCVADSGDGPPYEDGVATLDPSTCTWHFVADRRAEKARVQFKDPMCYSSNDVEIESAVEFIDVCDWIETITKVYNPMKRQVCAGKYGIAEWDSVKCHWIVTSVEGHIANITAGLNPCGDLNCENITQNTYQQASIETCNCTPVETPAIPMEKATVINGLVHVVGDDGAGNQTCELHALTASLCIVSCGSSNDPGTVKLLDYTKFKPMVELSEGSSALECRTQEAWVPCLGNFDTSQCVPLDDCPEPDDPVEEI